MNVFAGHVTLLLRGPSIGPWSQRGLHKLRTEMDIYMCVCYRTAHLALRATHNKQLCKEQGYIISSVVLCVHYLLVHVAGTHATRSLLSAHPLRSWIVQLRNVSLCTLVQLREKPRHSLSRLAPRCSNQILSRQRHD